METEQTWTREAVNNLNQEETALSPAATATKPSSWETAVLFEKGMTIHKMSKL